MSRRGANGQLLNGYRILIENERMHFDDLAWGHLNDGRIGWGALPTNLVGVPFSSASIHHPQFVIRKEPT